jgi:hypothetical protein
VGFSREDDEEDGFRETMDQADNELCFHSLLFSSD